jgi:hypothetical protein
LRVAHTIEPDNVAPSVQFHYRTFNPTASDSAPVTRLGTLILADAVRLDFSLRIGTTGSYVPYHSLIQAHAAFMPDASWAVDRLPPNLLAGQKSGSRFRRRLNTFRHVISGSLAFVFLNPT